MRRVIVYPDAATVGQATAARLLTALTDSLAVQDRVDVILTGGTVGIQTLRDAAVSQLATAVNWTAVHVWWGDERFVPSGHPERNEGQAQEALLRHLPLPEENIHRMGSSSDFASVEDAAAAYDALIAEHGRPEWDVAMFGMGPDGHVASLFPGHEVFISELDTNDARDVSARAVRNSPKPPPERVTLTLATINRAKEVWIVAAGAEKASAVGSALAGGGALPAGAVSGAKATLWLVDAAAATEA